MTRYISYLFFEICLFFVVSTFTIQTVNAQTCEGTRVCHRQEITCNPVGCIPGPLNPSCVCTDVGVDYTVSCGGIPPACGYESYCLSGDSIVSENCYISSPNTPTPVPDPYSTKLKASLNSDFHNNLV